MSTHQQSTRFTLGAAGLALAALAFACGGTDSSAAPGAAKAAPAKPATEAPLLPATAEPVPTADEAAAQAAKEIDDKNADAELEKLKKDLGDG